MYNSVQGNLYLNSVNPANWRGYLNFVSTNSNGTGLQLHHYNNSHGFIKFYENLYITPNGTNSSNASRGVVFLPDNRVIINGPVKYNLNETFSNIHQGYQLTVNGGILCEEVKVIYDVPNSDYVFESSYNLMPIDSVELFIKGNKHLPGIPSAKEFKENGYKVGEMDDMLLRKIEELTLYIIQLENRIKEIENNSK